MATLTADQVAFLTLCIKRANLTASSVSRVVQFNHGCLHITNLAHPCITLLLGIVPDGRDSRRVQLGHQEHCVSLPLSYFTGRLFSEHVLTCTYDMRLAQNQALQPHHGSPRRLQDQAFSWCKRRCGQGNCCRQRRQETRRKGMVNHDPVFMFFCAARSHIVSRRL